MKLRLQVLDRSHRKALRHLRVMAYRATYEEEVDPSTLEWGPDDERYVNLGIFAGERLVAAYRIDTVETEREFEIEIQAPLSEFPSARLPCAAMCRVATLPSVQGYGFSAALRLAAMDIAKARGLDLVISTTVKNAPNAKLFTEMGYEVIEHPGEWEGFLTPKGAKQVNILDLKQHLKRAQTVTERYLEGKGIPLRAGQFTGQPLTMDVEFELDPPAKDRPILTHRNHFNFGYNGVPFSLRKTPQDLWRVSYGRCEREPLPFGEECIETAKMIRASTTQDLHVLFSGGVDSEVTVRSFLAAKIPFQAAILRFADDLNLHDIAWAVTTCEALDVPYVIYDLDIVEFWKTEALRYADATYCISPQLLSTMWLVDQVPGYAILGSAECLFVRRGGKMAPGLTPEGQWDLWEKEKIAAWYRHFMATRRDGCPGFFQFTPEIMLAYVRDPMVQDLLNDRIPEHDNTEGIKAKVYERYFPLTPRTKYTGFERVYSYEIRLRDQLKQRYPGAGQMYITSIRDLVDQLTPAGAPVLATVG